MLKLTWGRYGASSCRRGNSEWRSKGEYRDPELVRLMESGSLRLMKPLRWDDVGISRVDFEIERVQSLESKVG